MAFHAHHYCPDGHAMELQDVSHHSVNTYLGFCDVCYVPFGLRYEPKLFLLCASCGWAQCRSCKNGSTQLSRETSKLRHLVMSFIHAMDDEARITVYKEWRAVDRDNSGTISLAELKAAIRERHTNLGVLRALVDTPERNIDALFRQMDQDNSGELDFWEAALLLLICAGYLCVQSCDWCNRLLLGDSIYTCPLCFVESFCPDSTAGGSEKAGQDVPGYCVACFDRHASQIKHEHAFHLVRNDLMWIQSAEESCITTHETTCSVCYDRHSVGVPAYLGGHLSGRHMVNFNGSWVCEWCCRWICRRCGDMSRSPAGHHSPGLWTSNPKCQGCSGKTTKDNWHFSTAQLTTTAQDTERLHCVPCQRSIIAGTIREDTAARASGGPSRLQKFNERVEAANNVLNAANQTLNVTASVLQACTIM